MKNNNHISAKLFFVFTFLFICIPAGYGQNLIPQPSRVESGEGTFTITPATVIVSHETDSLAEYLNDHIEKICGFRLGTASHAPGENYISLQVHRHIGHEAYTLQIAPRYISIYGGDRGGVFYGLQTLFQLMPPEVYGNLNPAAEHPLTLNSILIEDAPRFPYRGVMLDVSRTFFDKQAVMQYLDWMSHHKLNRFRWHLTDDNGWRIEIKKYPELTAKGAWRGPGEVLPPAYGSGQQRYGGYYTQDDIREVVRYAAFRNIEIIPEINLPGHSHAFTASYPGVFCRASDNSEPIDEEVAGNVLCAGREANFAVIRDIIHEVAQLFPSNYIHLGGDEVSPRYWKKCPQCQALMKREQMKSAKELFGYFVLRLEEIAHSEGKKCAFWDEAAKTNGLSSSTIISGWHDMKACSDAVNRGLPVVVMPASYSYIDMKQNVFDRGHTWAGMVDTRRIYSLDPEAAATTSDKAKYIRGVEAAQWAELLDRPDRFVEYQGYPRICALAEVGWSQPQWRNWEDFYHRLTSSHLDRLNAMGIQFHFFTPKIEYNKGTITATAAIPQAAIHFTTDDSDPTQASPLYTRPLQDTMPERYQFRAFYKNGLSTAVPPATTFDTLLHASTRHTFTFPLSKYVDKKGIWYLNVTPGEPETVINRLDVTGADTAYSIIRNGQRANPFANLRLYIDDKNRNADLVLTLSNNSPAANPVSFSFRPSPYLEPATTLTSSLAFSPRFPARGATDYNYTSYVRTSQACKKGDYILYTFIQPVHCRAITVNTGVPDVTRYIITQGTIEYSSDGVNFTTGSPLDANGSATIRPKTAVKAVRIAILGDNGEPIVALQDLQVLP